MLTIPNIKFNILNVLWTHSAGPRESTTTLWPLWWLTLLSIRVQTRLKHILICLLPQYQHQRNVFSERKLKEALSDTLMWAELSGLINNGKLTNQIVNLVAAMVKAVLNNDTCHHSAQNVVESRGTLHISSLITVQTSPNHTKFCLFYYHNIKWYRKYFFRAWAENGIAWHTDASSVVWAARLVAIAVKNTLDAALSQVRENNQHCLLVAIKFKYLLLHFHWLAVTKFCTWCKFVPFLYFFNKSTTNSNKSTGRTEITLILKIRNQLFIAVPGCLRGDCQTVSSL